MPPDDWLFRIEDMLVALDQILEFTRGKTLEEFRASPMLVNAVLYDFAILGEAAAHIPREVAEKYPEIEWRAIRGMRNTIVHEYSGVRLETVWETIQSDLVELRPKLQRIVANEG